MLSETKSHLSGRTLTHTLFFFLLVTQICFAQWYQQNSGTTNWLTAINFVDSNNGFVVGVDGTILHSTDAGDNWLVQNSAAGVSLNGIYTLEANTALAVGESGLIVRTTDGGLTWTNENSGTTDRLESVSFPSELIGWVVGGWYEQPSSEEVILRTTDGGVNWETKYLDSATWWGGEFGYPKPMFFLTPERGWVCRRDHILTTKDGGESWQQIPCEWHDYRSIHFADTSIGWIMWNFGTSEMDPFNCAIAKTDDGGINWSEQTIWDDCYPVYLRCFNTTDLIAIVFNTNLNYELEVRHSTNSGENWEVYPSGIFWPYPSEWGFVSYFIDMQTGWVIRGDGAIFHTTNGGVSFIEEEKIDEMPTEFLLSQNYPNPFNPQTSIQYAINSRQFVTLKVYDVLGNEIETLVNEEKSAGTYELTWDAGNLPSGVYFYQLKAGDFISTKKMILLK